jgi:hypothetical protein
MGNKGSAKSGKEQLARERGLLTSVQYDCAKAVHAMIQEKIAANNSTFKSEFMQFFSCSSELKKNIASGLWEELLDCTRSPAMNGGEPVQPTDCYFFCRLIEKSIAPNAWLRSRCKFYNRVCLHRKEGNGLSDTTASNLLRTGILLLHEIAPLVPAASPEMLPVNKTFRDEDELYEWMLKEFPLMVNALSAFLQYRISIASGGDFSFQIPQIVTAEGSVYKSSIFKSNELILFLWANIGCQNAAMKLLFNSTNDGMGFGRLVDSVHGYPGPTLIVIKDEDGNIFGGFTSTEWKTSKSFYGGEDSFIFTFYPYASVLRVRHGGSKNYQYLCDKDRHPRMLHGLGFGGDLDYTRLFLSSDLSAAGCTRRASGLTYEMGAIGAAGGEVETFTPNVIEVFGLGGIAADEMQARRKADRERFIRDRRKVDKAQLMDGFTQKYLLENTFKHKGEVSERGGNQ